MELLCPWDAPQYFIYSSNIPTLFFYSHIPAVIVALFVGLLVFFKSGKSRVGTTILIINLLFSVWAIFDLILWATNRPDVVMFFWSLQILIEPLIYLLGFYITYLFVKNQDLGLKAKLLGLLAYSPIALFLASPFNLIGVDLSYCTAIEGFIAQYYTYIFEAVSILGIVIFVAMQYKKAGNRKSEITIFGIGVVLFLIAFSSGNIIGSFTENWTIAQAGLVGMPIFVAFIAYMIVRFKTFKMKLIATQVLMASIWIIVLGILFIRNIENVRIVTALTLILVTISGDLLIKSVIKEVRQKEELARLNENLQILIKQRESLVHLITHKVKGSFTRTKFIFAGLLDGTFGDINPDVRKVAEQGLEFDDGGIQTVDLVLNVANLQNGLIKYEMRELDFKEVVLKTVDEKRLGVEAKGLKLELHIEKDTYKVVGDAFWLKEVVSNLIENSIKYTKEGTISVALSDGGKILLSVKDTGLGITEEDKHNLFTEGGRGKESIKVNVDSTGYGLFTVKMVVEAHKGKVWAESEGAGKGSQFYVELPIV
ncbi:MAG: HAMP domain-containing sensor histidine kinase [Minisyncoccia bacterium]